MVDSRRFYKMEVALFSFALLLSYLCAEAISGIAGSLVNTPGCVVIAIVIAAGFLFMFRQYVLGKKNRQFGKVVSQTIDSIMIGAAETAFFVEMVKKKIDADIVTVEQMVTLSKDNATSTHGIASNAEKAAVIAAKVQDECHAGRAQVSEALKCIGIAREGSQNAAAAMVSLQEKSKSVSSFAEMISEISAQTDLLALNAAVEAARAGEHGRGFAVVAAAVRQLSHRTKSTARDIDVMVHGIRQQAANASQCMDALNKVVSDAAHSIGDAHLVLARIEESSGCSKLEVEQISQSVRELVAQTRLISTSLRDIRGSMVATDGELPRAASSAMEIAEQAEVIAGSLGETATQTRHDTTRAAAQAAADAVAAIFTKAIRTGQISNADLFDRNYIPVPNTNPPKHRTRFDTFTDQVLPPIQESLIEKMPELAYACAVDNNGYLPTHNRRYSRPPTGNPEIDIVYSRNKRIFSDRTGARCGSNTMPFLLQTYKRDTGEVMHDLSVPIYVEGEHWGGFRIGYRSSTT